MKICPKCQKTYNDDSLNFCLDDGTVLQHRSSHEALPATVFINQAHDNKSASPEQATQPRVQSPIVAPAAQQSPPKKTSKAWIWAIGMLGLAILVCGGGFVGLIGYLSTLDVNTNSAGNGKNSSNRIPANNPVFNSPPRPTTAKTINDERTAVRTINLANWASANSAFGNAEFSDGELIVESREKGFYYVLVASREFATKSANTRVTIRNVDDASTNLGFGLIFHSNPTPLVQDYAFLIDSVKKKYRIVRHQSQNETTIADWTFSDAIKSGTERNILEVRDQAEKMEFYINGELVTSVNNTSEYQSGVAGIYSGDAIQVAFSDLEIRK